MANPIITDFDGLKLPVFNPIYKDDILQFPGADTYAMGTLLARKSVADTPVAAADGGNTGDGTVTVLSVVTGPVVPLVGVYNLTNIEVVANGGVFELTDPNGAIVAGNLTLTVGAGAATVFSAAGLQFTVTDGGTDFALADFFTITVAADGDLVVFATDGAGGAQIPLAILQEPITVTGAEDKRTRVLVGGEVSFDRLVIDADGDNSNIDAAVLDALRDFAIVGVPGVRVDELDNS